MRFFNQEEVESKNSITSIRPKEFLNLEEATHYLGFSKSHLYKLTSKRLIPFYQPSGRKILFRTSELEAWISQSKRETLQNIGADLVINKYKNKNND